jgi:pimeloyl-ACP methyl ester carboxylesterase
LVRLACPLTSILNMNIYTKEQAYATFRFGPAYPTAYPGIRFPLDAIDQYAPQWVLTYRDAEENAKITNAIVAAIDKVGPCIVMVHSQSGPLGLAAVLQRPTRQGLRCHRAGLRDPRHRDAESKERSCRVQTMRSAAATSWQRARKRPLTVNAIGETLVVPLPTLGILGNSHMMMMDNNNEQIADIIEKWISKNVRHVRD